MFQGRAGTIRQRLSPTAALSDALTVQRLQSTNAACQSGRGIADDTCERKQNTFGSTDLRQPVTAQCARQQGIGIIVIENIFATRFVTHGGPFATEDDFDRIVAPRKTFCFATRVKRNDYARPKKCSQPKTSPAITHTAITAMKYRSIEMRASRFSINRSPKVAPKT